MNAYKLKDLISIRNGKTYSHLKSGEVPLYGSGGIMGFVDNHLYSGPAILLPRKGTLTNIMFTEGEIWTVDTMYYAIVNSNANPYYLYSYLSLLNLEHLDSGTALPSMTKSSYEDIQVLLPSLEEQNKAGEFLMLIDRKMRLVDNIRSELDAMLATIYNYWFVQFDFPDTNGKPYRASGGKMIYNEVLKYEIPVDWREVTLNEVISKVGTGLNPRDNFSLGTGSNYYVTIKNIKGGKILLDDKCDKINDDALKIINKRSDLQEGDILFTSIEPVGITYLIQENPTNWNINESVFTVRANQTVSPEFLYMLLSSDRMKAYTRNSSAGSIHKGIRHSDLKNFPFAYSGKSIIDKFSTIVEPIILKIGELDKESSKLAELRNWLLPHIMNGQIRLK
jgi:type I restriction enzyme S subunit